MKIEEKSKFSDIAIEETESDLKISVSERLWDNPMNKKQTQFMTLLTLALAFFTSLLAFRIYEGIGTDFFFSVDMMLVIVFFLWALACTVLMGWVLFKYRFGSVLQVRLIEEHTISQLKDGKREILCTAPFNAVYVSVVSPHYPSLYNVIVRAGTWKRVVLFERLTQEQALYIARVIHHFLKLDSTETDFFEPEEMSPEDWANMMYDQDEIAKQKR